MTKKQLEDVLRTMGAELSEKMLFKIVGKMAENSVSLEELEYKFLFIWLKKCLIHQFVYIFLPNCQINLHFSIILIILFTKMIVIGNAASPQPV